LPNENSFHKRLDNPHALAAQAQDRRMQIARRREQDCLVAIWLISWLCERAFVHGLTLREEGQVELSADA